MVALSNHIMHNISYFWKQISLEFDTCMAWENINKTNCYWQAKCVHQVQIIYSMLITAALVLIKHFCWNPPPGALSFRQRGLTRTGAPMLNNNRSKSAFRRRTMPSILFGDLDMSESLNNQTLIRIYIRTETNGTWSSLQSPDSGTHGSYKGIWPVLSDAHPIKVLIL